MTARFEFLTAVVNADTALK